MNCNYAIELGPKVEWTKVVVIGISGKDLNDGNKKLTLGETVYTASSKFYVGSLLCTKAFRM